MKKQRVTSVLFLLSMLFIASCKDEPCDTIVCQNNAPCIDGICDCPPGFEGELCDEFSRQKILGNFDVTSNCTGDTSVTETWSISASSSAFNEVLIGNFHRPALNMFATIVDSNTIEIEEQIIGSYIIYGSGTIEGEGNLSIQYTAISADTTNCSVNALRQ